MLHLSLKIGGKYKMNELQIFNNNEFGKVRVINKKGQPWFVAKDICNILEISNLRDAINRLSNKWIDKSRKLMLWKNRNSRKKRKNILNFKLYQNKRILATRQKCQTGTERASHAEVLKNVKK